MCYSRCKSTQFCNINIANIALFTAQTIIIIIFNIRYVRHSCVRTHASSVTNNYPSGKGSPPNTPDNMKKIKIQQEQTMYRISTFAAFST